jgi:putative FmdB family regulatory protein
MPLYEYECNACGHRFEVIQKFSDPLVETCPKCGSVVHKLMSSPAIQFKGTGWYITDYAKKDSVARGESKGESTVESKGEAKAEPKADAKADTTAAPKSAAVPAKADAKPSTS